MRPALADFFPVVGRSGPTGGWEGMDWADSGFGQELSEEDLRAFDDAPGVDGALTTEKWEMELHDVIALIGTLSLGDLRLLGQQVEEQCRQREQQQQQQQLLQVQEQMQQRGAQQEQQEQQQQHHQQQQQQQLVPLPELQLVVQHQPQLRLQLGEEMMTEISGSAPPRAPAGAAAGQEGEVIRSASKKRAMRRKNAKGALRDTTNGGRDTPS